LKEKSCNKRPPETKTVGGIGKNPPPSAANGGPLGKGAALANNNVPISTISGSVFSTTAQDHASNGLKNKSSNTTQQNKEKKDNEISSDSCLYNASMGLVRLVESCCGKWGRSVATHPTYAILLCVSIFTLMAAGLLNINSELRPYKLWIPQDSEFIKVTDWQTENFPGEYRQHYILWESKTGNVLTAEAIQEMWKMHQEVQELVATIGDETVKWADVCVTVPSLLTPQSSEDYQSDYVYDENYAYESYDYENNDYVTPGPYYYDYQDNDYGSPIGLDYWVEETSQVGLDYWVTGTPFNWAQEGLDLDNLTTEAPTTKRPMSEAVKMRYKAVSTEIVEGIQRDSSISMNRTDYCTALEELHSTCFENSILEVFGYDDGLIMSLTDEQVVDYINSAYTSQIYGFPTEFAKYLGGIKRDENGTIVSADATIHTWTTQINKDAISSNINVTVDVGNGEIVDNRGYAWEEAFVEHAQKFNSEILTSHVHAAHSFGAVSGSVIHQNIKFVAAGWGILILYVLFCLGRIGPAIVGLVCIGLAVLASYGLCAAIGIPYGPINAVLPVLLVGLGVDDMFVIAASWDALAGVALKERAFKAMSHAGVAVTVTSITDTVAFMVGATTQVPALRWFCIYAAVGVSSVYILQATVFVAAMSIDQRLKDSGKTCSCSNSDKDKDKDKKNIGLLKRAMTAFSHILISPVFRIGVLVFATIILGWGLWGTVSLRQEFSPIWFLPQSSYLYKWFGAMDTHFPSSGESGVIYFSNVSLPEELPALRNLQSSLKEAPHVSKVNAWFSVLDVFINEHPKYQGKQMTSELFYDALGLFMHSSSGAIFRTHFLFDQEISCEDPAPHFSVFKIEFQYARQDERLEQQAAMLEVREIVASSNISGYHAAWAHVYSQWETDATLTGELWRNLSVVITVVALMTLLLLAAARAAFLVIVCVLATLLDVAALMHTWGLTVDTITCIALVLAIGLCVDYAAHVAHAFLVAKGNKKERARAAVADVGPAVLHGGVSTLLAFVMLAASDSYLFLSFCKIFTGVSAFGLFHGLVVLPVLLSFVGPESYPEGHDKEEDLEIVVVVGPLSKNVDFGDSKIAISHKLQDEIYGVVPINTIPTLKTKSIKRDEGLEYVSSKNINENNLEKDHENIIRIYVPNTLRKHSIKRKSVRRRSSCESVSKENNTNLKSSETGRDNSAFEVES